MNTRDVVPLFVLLTVLPCASVFPQQETPLHVRVTADEAALLAAPEAGAKPMRTVPHGTLLVLQRWEGDWGQVAAPADVDVWVYDKLVDNGTVMASVVQVRAGPGIRYPSIGTAEEGYRLAVRGTSGDWIKIAPPPGSYLWVNRSSIEEAVLVPPVPSTPEEVTAPDTVAKTVSPPPPEPAVVTPHPAGPPAVAASAAHGGREVAAVAAPPHEIKPVAMSTPAPTPVTPPLPPVAEPAVALPVEPAKPSPSWAAAVHRNEVEGSGALPKALIGASLAPVAGQGVEVERTGTIRETAMAWQRPCNYRLVSDDKIGRSTSLCFLCADDVDLSRMLGRHVRLTGKEYYLQGVRLPVVAVTLVNPGK